MVANPLKMASQRMVPQKEAAHMQEPMKQQKLDYVADMAEQLATLCKDDHPPTAALLRAAAKSARDHYEKRRQR